MKPLQLTLALLLATYGLKAQEQMRGRGGNLLVFQIQNNDNRNVQSIEQTASNVQNLNFNNINSFNLNNSRGSRGGNDNVFRGNRGANPVQNTDRAQAIQIVNDNRHVQSIQVIEIQRGNRGNSADRNIEINADLAMNGPKQTRSSNDNRSQDKIKLTKIELPSPKSIEVTTKEKAIDKTPIDLGGLGKSDKKKKASQGWGRNPNNKHFMKKRVWRPIGKWFKRHFKRTKKPKAKFTCFF